MHRMIYLLRLESECTTWENRIVIHKNTFSSFCSSTMAISPAPAVFAFIAAFEPCLVGASAFFLYPPHSAAAPFCVFSYVTHYYCR